MLTISNHAKLFLFAEPVNMLKSFEGLSGLVETAFPGNLLKAYFIFLNRNRDKMKVLYWDGDGFSIWYKRLEKGSFIRSKEGSTELNRREFFMLLEGVTPKKLQRRFSLK
jgi:transposase